MKKCILCTLLYGSDVLLPTRWHCLLLLPLLAPDELSFTAVTPDICIENYEQNFCTVYRKLNESTCVLIIYLFKNTLQTALII